MQVASLEGTSAPLFHFLLQYSTLHPVLAETMCVCFYNTSPMSCVQLPTKINDTTLVLLQPVEKTSNQIGCTPNPWPPRSTLAFRCVSWWYGNPIGREVSPLCCGKNMVTEKKKRQWHNHMNIYIYIYVQSDTCCTVHKHLPFFMTPVPVMLQRIVTIWFQIFCPSHQDSLPTSINEFITLFFTDIISPKSFTT